jgi:cytochrome P450
MSQAPGPRSNWLMGSLSDARRDPLGFFLSSAEEHGDVVRFRLGPTTAFLLRGADAFKQVFIDEQRNFTKDTNAYRSIRLVLGNGLVTSEGDFWLRQRRIAQPAFRREKIASVDTIVVEETGRMLEGWGPRAARGEPFDVFEEVTNALARITGRSLLGADVSGISGELSTALGSILELAQKRALSVFPLPPSLPTPQNRRMHAARAVMDRFIYATIEERRAKGAAGSDLLSRLMTAKDEETGAAPRRGHDALQRRLRDHGHGARLVALPPVEEPDRPRSLARGDRPRPRHAGSAG